MRSYTTYFRFAFGSGDVERCSLVVIGRVDVGTLCDELLDEAEVSLGSSSAESAGFVDAVEVRLEGENAVVVQLRSSQERVLNERSGAAVAAVDSVTASAQKSSAAEAALSQNPRRRGRGDGIGSAQEITRDEQPLHDFLSKEKMSE